MYATKVKRRQQALRELQRKVAATKPASTTNSRKQVPRKKKSTMGPAGAKNNWMKNSYAMCRINPFMSMGKSTGIPDGTNVRRLLVDHRLTSTLTFGPLGTLSLIVCPALPSPLWVQATDAGLLINGVVHAENNPNPKLYIPVPLNEWASKPTTWLATAGTLNQVSTVYDAAKFRLVTLGYRIKYLGTSLSDSGKISVSTLDFTIENPVPNPAALTIFSSTSGTNTNIGGASEVAISFINCPELLLPTAAFSSVETCNVSLKEGVEGKLNHTGNDYAFQNLSRNMTYVVDSQNDNASLLMQNIPVPPTVGDSAVIQGLDPNWNANIVSITGGLANQAVMVDVIMCVEYCPQPTSDSYSLAKNGPAENRTLLQKVDNYLKSKPVASSLTSLVGIARSAVDIGSALMF